MKTYLVMLLCHFARGLAVGQKKGKLIVDEVYDECPIHPKELEFEANIPFFECVDIKKGVPCEVSVSFDVEGTRITRTPSILNAFVEKHHLKAQPPQNGYTTDQQKLDKLLDYRLRDLLAVGTGFKIHDDYSITFQCESRTLRMFVDKKRWYLQGEANDLGLRCTLDRPISPRSHKDIKALQERLLEEATGG